MGKNQSFMRGMRVPLRVLGQEHWGIRWVIPRQEGIDSPSDEFCHGDLFVFGTLPQSFQLFVAEIDIGSFHGFSSCNTSFSDV